VGGAAPPVRVCHDDDSALRVVSRGITASGETRGSA
jgi:hypothetical protein